MGYRAKTKIELREGTSILRSVGSLFTGYYFEYGYKITRKTVTVMHQSFPAMFPVLPPTRATNFHLAESRRCFYFLQHENLKRAELVIHHHQSLFKNTKSYHKNALPRSRVKNYKRINELYLQEYINYISKRNY